MKQVLLMVLLVVGVAFQTFSQHRLSKLSGLVYDEITGQPVVGANITLMKEQQTDAPLSQDQLKLALRKTVSDVDGTFLMEWFDEGNYIIILSCVGYKTKSQSLIVDQSSEVRFDLSPDNQLIDPVSISFLTLKNLRTNWSGSGNSLASKLEKLKNMHVLKSGVNREKPIFQGLHSHRLLLVNNQVRQEGQQWGEDHAPEVDPFVADFVEVIKGVDELKYGSDAVGGVILIHPRRLNQTHIDGAAILGYDTNNQQYIVSGSLDYPLPRIPDISIQLQGTHRKGGNIRTPYYFLNNTSQDETDFSLRLGYTVENKEIEVYYSHFHTRSAVFKGATVGNLTDLMAAIEAERPHEIYLGQKGFQMERAYQQVKHDLLKLRSSFHLGQQLGHLQIQLAAQVNDRKEFDVMRNQAISTPQINLLLDSYSQQVVWKHPAFKKLSGELGFSGSQQINSYQGRYLIPGYVASSYGVYWIEKWQYSNWDFQAGIRFDQLKTHTIRIPYDNHPVKYDFDFSTFAASFQSKYHISNAIQWQGQFSKTSRPPHVSELLMDGTHQGTARYTLGDPTLQIERANYLSTGFIYTNEANKLKLDWSIFLNEISDFIYLQPRPHEPVITIAGVFPKFVYQQADVSLSGSNISLQYKPVQQVEFNADASILRTYNKTLKDWLIGMPSDRLSLAATYTMPDLACVQDSKLNLNMLWYLKQTRVPSEEIHGRQDYKAPPNGYALLNISLHTSFSLFGRQIEAQVNVYNLLNSVYRDYLNSMRYFSDEMGRNTSIRLKYQFNGKSI